MHYNVAKLGDLISAVFYALQENEEYRSYLHVGQPQHGRLFSYSTVL